MLKNRSKNAVRYYVLLVVLFLCLFLSNDFGLLDVQKTAIVTAVGVDFEDEGFLVTSQIALPEPSTQGERARSVQIVSRGKTVADAFAQINAKTGWYPKLVFCNLLLLGEGTEKRNVFDALDFFLLDEYLSDSCLVAACDGKARELLNTQALVDPSSSEAAEKVLSAHAERVGSTLPVTLQAFAAAYRSDAASGYLPILKKERAQEGREPQTTTPSSPEGGSEQTEGGASSKPNNSNESNEETKPVFSARETALFVRGKRVGRLTAAETFAFSATRNALRLAPYSLEQDGVPCTLSVRKNETKCRLVVGKTGDGELRIRLTLTAGLLDVASSRFKTIPSDAGDVPSGAFAAAERKLEGEIRSAFEKSRACGCDLFGLRDLVKKYAPSARSFAPNVLSRTRLSLSVRFQNVR